MSRLIPSIPTMSLGQGAAGHLMETKLRAAAATGFKGIEVFYACLESFSQTFPNVAPCDKLRATARVTKQLADELGLTIVVLQPLLGYNGLVDLDEHKKLLEEAIFRFELCGLLGCDMMQVPANFRLDDGITGDEEAIVRDLQELADAGLAHNPPIRFAYENMCWSTYSWRWQQAWNIVKKVDRSNFGIVLDTFQIAGYEYANQTLPGGTVTLDKIFYLQLVDAKRLSLPLLPLGAPSPAPEEIGKTVSPFHVDGQQPRMSWSRHTRLFAEEQEREGYMPIAEVYKTFLDTGFEGYVSFELFTRFVNDSHPSIPQNHAERGWKSWLALQKKLDL
ncbi:hypothetical protein JCM10207_000364 [Rhodosporidiobolus poonsookiae]